MRRQQLDGGARKETATQASKGEIEEEEGEEAEGAGEKNNKSRAKKKKVKRHRSERTLFPLLESLVGMRVCVELKNDTRVVGKLEEVRFPTMNLVFEEATLEQPVYTSAGTVEIEARTPTDAVHVSGRLIRYVHIPDGVNVIKLMRRREMEKIQADLKYSRSVRKDKKRVIDPSMSITIECERKINFQ